VHELPKLYATVHKFSTKRWPGKKRIDSICKTTRRWKARAWSHYNLACCEITFRLVMCYRLSCYVG